MEFYSLILGINSCATEALSLNPFLCLYLGNCFPCACVQQFQTSRPYIKHFNILWTDFFAGKQRHSFILKHVKLQFSSNVQCRWISPYFQAFVNYVTAGMWLIPENQVTAGMWVISENQVTAAMCLIISENSVTRGMWLIPEPSISLFSCLLLCQCHAFLM